MTGVEMLMQLHPEWNEETAKKYMYTYCPFEVGFTEYQLPGQFECSLTSCDMCWDMVAVTKEAVEKPDKDDVFEPSDVSIDKIIKKECAKILDSGDRTEFASGAVRDMREGKGRCDLMPLDMVSDYLHDRTLYFIYLFQQDGNVSHLSTALGASEMYQDPFSMLLEVAKHFEAGAKKYGENNWQKGIPVWCYIDSAVRHYLKYKRGDTDEPHDRAFVWNILCAMWTVEHIKE